MFARQFVRSVNTYTSKKGLSGMKDLIKKEVNYDFLLNKLQCKNECSCTKFVKSLKVKDIERYPHVWKKVSKLKNGWCPIGPQSPPQHISQEEEERELQREIMSQEDQLYYYHTEPIYDEEDLRKYA